MTMFIKYLKRKIAIGATIVFCSQAFLGNVSASDIFSGFDLSNSIIPLSELHGGGPGKDDIPSIDNPVYIAAEKAVFLNSDDIVIGLAIKGKALAYPIKILNWHEIVNDNLDGKNFSVTWCPLTYSAFVFERKMEDHIFEFGVSGLLYKSNLTMYDRNSSALWPQITGGPVSGQYAGKKLTVIPSLLTTWQTWRVKYPETLVLSADTRYPRDYTRDPYEQYHQTEDVMFPVAHQDHRLRPKEMVLGLMVGDVAKAYPVSGIQGLKEPLRDIIDGQSVIVYSDVGPSVYITDTNGRLLSATQMYWFAWSAFHKDTLLYQSDKGSETGYEVGQNTGDKK